MPMFDALLHLCQDIFYLNGPEKSARALAHSELLPDKSLPVRWGAHRLVPVST
jgi:hypothetical protein